MRTQFGAVSVLVRENETSLPQLAVNRPPRKMGPARLLFVSRLDQKKGLQILLESLQSITQPVELKIVGAFVDSEYESLCRRLLEQLGQNVSVEFCGPLKRDDVLAQMQSADLLVFPTAGENFGHVIAEALSQSCPVMCSANSPWTNRLKKGGGIVVQSNVPGSWSLELQDFLLSGPQAWEKAAASAGQSFTAWRNEDKGTHVFTLASNNIHQRG
ncbi:glycosyltransferase [Corynebacterium casei]|uniref:glycosyltransferase n=1 Tax=Corynebacterium casei TaxID=160386 RepID=UPI003FCF4DBA